MNLASSTFTPDASATASVLDDLALYGATPPEDETDYRPLPEEDQLEIAISSMVKSSARCRLGRDLDVSDVKCLELDRKFDVGQKLVEHRDAYEAMRDASAARFHTETGSIWMPRSGSRVSHKNLTASVVDSRNFLSAERRKKNEIHCPDGTRIAFTGGDYQDYDAIWTILDGSREKYPDMILLHGGTPNGAERIASLWAENRGVTQVVFRPDWKSHNKAAPFKRNDQLLKTMPKGIIACPGSGIHENLVDKSRKLGIPVKRIGG
jgi:hypothetical protein